jgi:hypothetical protein
MKEKWGEKIRDLPPERKGTYHTKIKYVVRL